eukprot:m.98292 g.98292  ORF g.98292 m.98292 type:complete len:234 (-) comp15556_c3_seq5:208-909(-)
MASKAMVSGTSTATAAARALLRTPAARRQLVAQQPRRPFSVKAASSASGRGYANNNNGNNSNSSDRNRNGDSSLPTSSSSSSSTPSRQSSNAFSPFSLFGGVDPFRSFWDMAPFPSFSHSQNTGLGSTDIVETDKELIFQADAPGLTKDDVKVQIIDGDVLTISGERKQEKEETSDKFHRIERSYGKFSRSFRLPDTVDKSKVAAKVENGTLRVTLPKIPAPQSPKNIDVEIQ